MIVLTVDVRFWFDEVLDPEPVFVPVEFIDASIAEREWHPNYRRAVEEAE